MVVRIVLQQYYVMPGKACMKPVFRSTTIRNGGKGETFSQARAREKVSGIQDCDPAVFVNLLNKHSTLLTVCLFFP